MAETFPGSDAPRVGASRGFLPVAQPQAKSNPNMLNTADTSDELNPTTIVLNYLKSKGLQPNADNIRRAVDANARDPGVLGPNLIGNVGSGGRDIELRNAAPEDSSPMVSAMRKAMAPASNVDSGQFNVPPSGSGNTSAMPTPSPGGPSAGPTLPIVPPPPVAPSPVGVPPVPSVSPPPAGAAAALPAPPAMPPDLTTALTRATTPQLQGPSAQLALPAPETSPQLRLPAPTPQLALPAPPVRPQIAGPPEVPALPAPTPSLGGVPNAAEPAPAVKIAPGPRIQGAPIEPGPVMGPLGRSVVGGVAGGLRGGPKGAIVGAAPGAIDLGRYIAKNLHLY